MAATDDAVAAFLEPLERHINGLGSDNKSTVKRGVAAVHKALLGTGNSAGWGVRCTALGSTLAAPLLRVLDAGSERNRELVLDCLTELVAALARLDAANQQQPDTASSVAAALEVLVSLLLPVLARKYVVPHAAAVKAAAAYGPVEPAEELRAMTGALLRDAVPVLETYGVLAPFVDDILDVVLVLLMDPFHDVLRSGAQTMVALCAAARDAMRMRTSQTVINTVLGLLGHQHSRIRVSAVEALEALVLCKDMSLTVDLVKDLNRSLTTLVSDRTPKVRSAAIRMLASWLTTLTDRHVYTRYLVPPLLVGLTDDIPDINALTFQLVEDVAAVASSAEAEDIMEEETFGDDPVLDPALTPPAFGGVRPSLAARRLVGRKIHDMLPPILSDMSDWTAKRRLTAARLLSVIIVFGERGMASFVPDIITTLLTVAVDDDPDILASIYDAAAMLGSFVEPRATVLPLIDIAVDAQGVRSLQARGAALKLLARVLQGTPPDSLANAVNADNEPLTAALLVALAEAPSFEIQDEGLHVGLTRVANVLVSHALVDTSVADAAPLLVQLLVSQLAWATTDSLRNATQETLAALAARLGAASARDLVAANAEPLIARLVPSVPLWTTARAGALEELFQILAYLSAPVVQDLMVGGTSTPLADVLASAVDSVEPDTLATLLVAVSKTLTRDQDAGLDGSASDAWLAASSQLLIPQLVWRAGLSAANLREGVARLLLALTTTGAFAPAGAAALLGSLVSVNLENLIDDRLVGTRAAVVELLGKLVAASSEPDTEWDSAFVTDTLGSVHTSLVTRLNDAEDAIRIATATALAALLAHGATLLGPQVTDSLAATLFIHVDDPARPVRSAMVHPLTLIASTCPTEAFVAALAQAKASATNASVELAAISDAVDV